MGSNDTPKIGNGLVQFMRMGGSTRQMWVNNVNMIKLSNKAFHDATIFKHLRQFEHVFGDVRSGKKPACPDIEVKRDFSNLVYSNTIYVYYTI